MNKPAPKEPSMDEILSSIRQIIADDDAAAAPRRTAPPAPAAPAANAPPMQPAGMRPAAPNPPPDHEPMTSGSEDVRAPLALSPNQIVHSPEPKPEPMAPIGRSTLPPLASTSPRPPEPERVPVFTPPKLVEPDDISFEPDDADEPEPAPMRMPFREPPPVPRAQVRPADAAPMPDRTLSRDLSEQLLEPATNSVVRQNLQRLSGLSIGAPGLTVEAMIRDMLRPMLKDWLDENLPSMVERMVEKEIARISRGVE